MLKWQENFLAGESVKDPEEIKKKLNSGKPVLGIYLLTLSENPVNLMDIIPAAMLIQKSFLWNLSEDHRNGEGQRGSPGDGAKSDR